LQLVLAPLNTGGAFYLMVGDIGVKTTIFSPPYKVLHVITRFILGGAQENTLLSAIGLRNDADFQPVLVTGPAVGAEGSLLERAAKEKIQTVIVNELVRPIAPRKDLKAYFILRRIIREHRPVIVHTHSSKAGIIGRQAAKDENVPVIIHTIHGPPFHAFEKRWRNALYAFLERRAARLSDALVCVADAMRDQYLARNIGTQDQYITIRSGMEIEPYLTKYDRPATRNRLGIPANAFVFAKIARIAPLKGHEDVLAAAGKIIKDCPNIHFLFIGDGELRDKIEKLVNKSGMVENVTFTGLVPPDAIPELLGAADCLVHASYREGLPRAVVQGMLAGLPAIAYATDGTPEVIEDGRTGYLLQVADVQGFADRMKLIVEDPLRSREMGLAGRERVKGEFSWQNMSNELIRLYRSIMVRKGLVVDT